MKLWMKLFLALLLVSVLPTWLITRYASATFHHFTRKVQEDQMVVTGRWMGALYREVADPGEREAVWDAHAADSGRRLRFFDAGGNLIYDSGETDELDFDGNSEVSKAMSSGKYAARWWLMPDRSRLYYFSAVPAFDGTGALVGAAQVVEHTGRITLALFRLHAYQRSGLWWVGGGAVLLSMLFSLLLTRRLQRLRAAAREFAAEGNAEVFALEGRDEVAELAAGFREMAERLQARQAYNREFVQTTLHELKTPLTAMHGAADILKTRETLSDADRRRFSGNIQVQSDRLLHLVQELQTLTALDMELPTEAAGAVAAGPLLTEILDRVRPALTHPVLLEGGEISRTLRIPPARLEQVLINLLQNADRYHCGEHPIRVRLTGEKQTLRLAVEDDGPGIAEEDPLRIFERYFSTVPRDKNLPYGRGLGLAVVKRIAEHYGGRVFAENREPGGASVGMVF